MSDDMTALDVIVLDSTTSDERWSVLPEARAELAALRADIQRMSQDAEETERAMNELSFLSAEVTALRHAVNEARELRGLAEELVNALGYWLSLDQEPQECVKAEFALGEWLAAHPAPEQVTP